MRKNIDKKPPAPAAPSTPEELKALALARAEKCLAAINEVLEEHNCEIGTRPVIDADGTVQSIWGVNPK